MISSGTLKFMAAMVTAWILKIHRGLTAGAPRPCAVSSDSRRSIEHRRHACLAAIVRAWSGAGIRVPTRPIWWWASLARRRVCDTAAKKSPPANGEAASVSKSLLTTNPYLRDPKARWTALPVSAASSSAIEGIRKPFSKTLRYPTQPAELQSALQ